MPFFVTASFIINFILNYSSKSKVMVLWNSSNELLLVLFLHSNICLLMWCTLWYTTCSHIILFLLKKSQPLFLINLELAAFILFNQSFWLIATSIGYYPMSISFLKHRISLLLSVFEGTLVSWWAPSRVVHSIHSFWCSNLSILKILIFILNYSFTGHTTHCWWWSECQGRT